MFFVTIKIVCEFLFEENRVFDSVPRRFFVFCCRPLHHLLSNPNRLRPFKTPLPVIGSTSDWFHNNLLAIVNFFEDSRAVDARIQNSWCELRREKRGRTKMATLAILHVSLSWAADSSFHLSSNSNHALLKHAYRSQQVAAIVFVFFGDSRKYKRARTSI